VIFYFEIQSIDKKTKQKDKKNKPEKLTKAQIQKNQEEALLKSMEKKFSVNPDKPKKKENSDDSDDDQNPPLEPNINHIQREQAIIDSEKYSEVIDGKYKKILLLYTHFRS